jgi:putative hydrolase of the HAD superfamily
LLRAAGQDKLIHADRISPVVVVKAVIFDYGGTLVGERKPWKQIMPTAVYSAYRVLKQAGLALTFEEYKEVNDSVFQKYALLELEENEDIPDVVTYQEIVNTLFQSGAKTWRRRIATKADEAFWTTATKNFVLKRSARPVLRKLKAMKLNMAILSNHHYPRAEIEHLNRLRIASYFSRIMISAQEGLRKPDPRFFAMCLASMNVRPRQAVFVGDSLTYDVEGAKRAGMYSVLVASDAAAREDESSVVPDFVVHDLLEVPQVVSSLSNEP